MKRAVISHSTDHDTCSSMTVRRWTMIHDNHGLSSIVFILMNCAHALHMWKLEYTLLISYRTLFLVKGIIRTYVYEISVKGITRTYVWKNWTFRILLRRFNVVISSMIFHYSRSNVWISGTIKEISLHRGYLNIYYLLKPSHQVVIRQVTSLQGRFTVSFEDVG